MSSSCIQNLREDCHAGNRFHRSRQYGRADGRQPGQVGRTRSRLRSGAGVVRSLGPRRHPDRRQRPEHCRGRRCRHHHAAGGEHVVSVWNDIVPRARQARCSSIARRSTWRAPARPMPWRRRAASARSMPRCPAASAAPRRRRSPSWSAAPTLPLARQAGPGAHGQTIVHCGEAGNGQVAKICNNMILAASMIALGEAFVMGEKLGLSHQALFDVASASSGQCWALTSYCPEPGPVPASPANNGDKPGFAASLMLKDLRLAREAARSAKVKKPSAHTPRKSTKSFPSKATVDRISPESSISFERGRNKPRRIHYRCSIGACAAHEKILTQFCCR